MKVLISFEPNYKNDNFEGMRLRKTIKNALEVNGIKYATNIGDDFQIAHFISPNVDNQVLNEINEKHIPVVVSALYCEDDINASFIESVYHHGNVHIKLKPKAYKILNLADLILVPTPSAKKILLESGIDKRIEVVKPGINMARFDFSRDDEKELFYRYFNEDPQKKLVIGLGDSHSSNDIKAFINAAKHNKDVNFYYVGYDLKTNHVPLKVKLIVKQAPKNVKFVKVMPEDIYRSALMNASIFVGINNITIGAMSLIDAMAAKNQIIIKKPLINSELVNDGINGYSAIFSETLTSLIDKYFIGKLKETTEYAYRQMCENNLKIFGEKLINYYQELINKKED